MTFEHLTRVSMYRPLTLIRMLTVDPFGLLIVAAGSPSSGSDG